MVENMLNIKSQEAHQLAAAIAKLTGESLTKAVTESLRARLEQLEGQDARAEKLMAIGRACASRLTEPHTSIDHGDLLYDERGLPK